MLASNLLAVFPDTYGVYCVLDSAGRCGSLRLATVTIWFAAAGRPKTGTGANMIFSDLSHERMLDRAGKRNQSEYWSAQSTGGMVATAHYLATRAGAEILTGGGNAFDAAVCAALALGVCEPAGSGIGGMAILLAHDAAEDRTFVVEGACRAPQDATPQAIAESRSRYRGYRAVAVPTHLAVLNHTLGQYGTMTPEAVLQPSIRIAEEGFPLSSVQHSHLVQYRRTLRRRSAGRFFLDENQEAFRPGTLFRQPVLAATLRRLATHGLEDFYSGRIAKDIVTDMEAHGGFVNARDLASSRLFCEGPAIEVQLGQDLVRSVGPPGGGLALLEMLNLASQFAPSIDPGTPDGAVLVAAIIRQARRDRRRFRLSTDAQGVGGATELLTAAYAADTAGRIQAELERAARDQQQSQRSDEYFTGGETSHLSVMDAQGNIVALTQSIERNFGSAVVTPSLGFLYNGYLRAFKVQNTQHPHYLRPGTPARSNAAPTIAFRDGAPWLSLGSTGSERMASSIFQVLTRLSCQKPFDAVHAPRLHCTPESQVFIEADRYDPGCLRALSRHGFSLSPVDPYSFKMGGLQLVTRRGQSFCGVGEPRRDGAAAGPMDPSVAAR